MCIFLIFQQENLHVYHVLIVSKNTTGKLNNYWSGLIDDFKNYKFLTMLWYSHTCTCIVHYTHQLITSLTNSSHTREEGRDGGKEGEGKRERGRGRGRGREREREREI